MNKKGRRNGGTLVSADLFTLLRRLRRLLLSLFNGVQDLKDIISITIPQRVKARSGRHGHFPAFVRHVFF